MMRQKYFAQLGPRIDDRQSIHSLVSPRRTEPTTSDDLRLAGGMRPPCPVLHHRVEDRQQLPHTGRQGHLLGLARRTQALVERADHGIESGGHEGAHVEDRTHLCATAPDRARASQHPTVAIERGHADQGRDLLAGQRAKFRQCRQQRRCHHRPHAGRALQELLLLAPDRTLTNRLCQCGVGLLDGPLQPGDVRAQTFADGRKDTHQPVPLRRQHLDQLPTSAQQGGQGPCFCIRERSRLRSHDVGKPCEHLGIQRIGFGQLPGGLGKVAHLAGD